MGEYGQSNNEQIGNVTSDGVAIDTGLRNALEQLGYDGAVEKEPETPLTKDEAIVDTAWHIGLTAKAFIDYRFHGNPNIRTNSANDAHVHLLELRKLIDLLSESDYSVNTLLNQLATHVMHLGLPIEVASAYFEEMRLKVNQFWQQKALIDLLRSTQGIMRPIVVGVETTDITAIHLRLSEIKDTIITAYPIPPYLFTQLLKQTKLHTTYNDNETATHTYTGALVEPLLATGKDVRLADPGAASQTYDAHETIVLSIARDNTSKPKHILISIGVGGHDQVASLKGIKHRLDITDKATKKHVAAVIKNARLALEIHT